MSAFDGASKVKRAFYDPETDHKLPHPGSLRWEAITTTAALPGTIGAHCDVVHGDRSYLLKRGRTENITGKHKHTMDGNQAITIVGKHKETIAQDCCQSFIGPHLVTNHTVRNETRMANCSTCYGSWWVNDDVGHTTTLDGIPYSGQGDRWYYADTYYQFARVLNHEVEVVKTEAQGVHLEVGAAHMAVKLLHCEADISHPQAYLNDDKSAISWDRYGTIDNKVTWNGFLVQAFDYRAKVLSQSAKSVSQEVTTVESGNELGDHALPRIGTFIPPPLP